MGSLETAAFSGLLNFDGAFPELRCFREDPLPCDDELSTQSENVLIPVIQRNNSIMKFT